jgi:hypothetical protein
LIIHSIDLLSSTPPKAGPVKSLFTLWQLAHLAEKSAFPSSEVGAANVVTADRKVTAKNMKVLFMFLMFL